MAVLGAGNIGCWVGGHLAASEVAEVNFIHRESTTGSALAAAVLKDGLRLVGCDDGGTRVLRFSNGCRHRFTSDAKSALADRDVIFVAVKRQHNATVAALLSAYAKPSATIVLLQNGIGAAAEMREMLAASGAGGGAVVDCMVASNVVGAEAGSGVITCPSPVDATSRVLALGIADPSAAGDNLEGDRRAAEEVVKLLRSAGLDAVVEPELSAVLHNKLLLNLINAVNALSCVDIPTMLYTRGYRLVWRASLVEAKAVLAAAGIATHLPSGRTDKKLDNLPLLLGLPQLLALPVVTLATRGRTGGRTSMAADLQHGRPTEVNYINGQVVALGLKHGVPTPVNSKLVELVNRVSNVEDAEARSQAG